MRQRVSFVQSLHFFILWFVTRTVAVSRPTAITIDNNVYKGILVAIHPDVSENSQLIDKIKAMFTDGSAYLYTATEKRAYFGEITILVPNTWSSNSAWKPATTELYNDADVVVKDPVITRRKRSVGASTTPYSNGAFTRSYGGCGQAGVRINIFTDLFFGTGANYKFGPIGRVLVHEWAHFRWGVFDEYSQEGEPQFYFSPTTGQLEAVRCNINMEGRIYKKDPVTGRAEICHMVDPATGMFDEDCVFNPYTIGPKNDNITASIMDRQKVQQIIHFCNDDRSDKKRVHNYESPSRHNRLCGSRSTWAVISESPDFVGGKNSPRDVTNTTPTFKVVRMSNARRMILAIDSSQSMEDDDKLIRARQAATSFIEDGLNDGTSLGIVSFSKEAKLVSPLTNITNDASRKRMSRSLPSKAEGSTSVGAALLKSIEVLQQHDANASDAFIVLFTDGQQTSKPTLDDVMHKVQEAGAVVSVIAFCDNQDRSLEKLTRHTGGRYYFDSNREKSTSAVDSMLDVYRLFDSGKGNLPVLILSQAKTLHQHETLEGTFLLDNSLGKDTRIVSTYTSERPPEVIITSPSGRKYSSLYPEYEHDPMLKRVKITIPLIAETGRWVFSIANVDVQHKRVSLLVMSTGRNRDTPSLEFTGSFFVENDTWPVRSTIVAEVRRGDQPLTGLKVKAMVHRPMNDPVIVELYDQGAGADVVKNDGVYSRFFTRFTTTGWYSVTIEMMDKYGDVVITSLMNTEPSHVAKAYAGSVHIEHPKLPSQGDPQLLPGLTIDEYPPMRITDLRVLHTSHGNGTIVLAWTAPGDDGDYDRAESYTLVMSSSAEAIVIDEDLPTVDSDIIVKGSLDSPKSFGEKEEIKLQLDIPDESKVSLVFSIFATDESGNKGELSNLVTVGLGFVPDINTQEYQEEQADDYQADAKAAPSSQRVVIASVVGSVTGLLVLTILGTVCVHAYAVFSRRKKEERLYPVEKNHII